VLSLAIIVTPVPREAKLVVEYWGVLEPSEHAFFISFPDAPGCTAAGQTPREVFNNASAALSEWLDDARQEGLGYPKARSRTQLLEDPEVAPLLAPSSGILVKVWPRR
jgi:predicted RNase H-like HicB family nuclease